MDFVEEFKLNDLLPVATDSDGENYSVGNFSFERSADTPEYVRDLIRAAASYYAVVSVEDDFKEHLSCEPKYVGRNKLGDWEHFLWNVSIKFDGTREITVPYMLGLSHIGVIPTLDDVLDSLSADCRMLETLSEETFEQWCLEFGANNDSIKDLRIFEQVVNVRNELKFLFGTNENFEKFMNVFGDTW